MSPSRIARALLQLAFALFLILYGVYQMIDSYATRDMPFGEYRNLEDCIAKNQDKRDPRQYCLAIRRRVERARRRNKCSHEDNNC